MCPISYTGSSCICEFGSNFACSARAVLILIATIATLRTVWAGSKAMPSLEPDFRINYSVSPPAQC